MPDIGRLGFWSTITKIYHDKYRCSSMLFQVLRIEGALTPGIVRKALYWLQRRHPLLRAHFVDDGRYYRFKVAHDNNGEFDEKMLEVPLRVVNRGDASPWEEIIEDELTRDFDPDTQALWRTIFLHAENQCHYSELIIFFHHALSDGLSATRFAHDLLLLCSQIAEGAHYLPDRVVLPLLPAAELMVPEIASSSRFAGRDLRDNSPERRQTPWDYEAYKPLNERTARSLYFQINERSMINLKARCKKEHTTVNSALMASLLLSAFKKTDSTHHVCFSFAIDLRRYCEPKVTSEHFGCYIMMEQAVLTLSEKISFWDLARNCGKELIKRVDLRRKQRFLPREFHKSFLSSMVESNLSKSDAQQQFSGGPALSNLGDLNLLGKYGQFQLREIYFGTPHLSGLYSVFLSVVTVHGRLFCTLAYTEPLLSRETASSIADSFVSRLETVGNVD